MGINDQAFSPFPNTNVSFPNPHWQFINVLICLRPHVLGKQL